MKTLKQDKGLIIASVLAVLAASLFIKTYLTIPNPIEYSQLENIDGIPFPIVNHEIIVTEKLAHSDIYTPTSILGKEAKIKISFTPNNIQRLDIGIRENPFWLSYPWHQIYEAKPNIDPTKLITKTITIPLTDKIVDSNNSVDLMLFATTPTATNSEDEGINDSTNWTFSNLSIEMKHYRPTTEQLKDYIRSILKQEKPA